MSWQLPPTSQTLKAIELYLSVAYISSPPSSVRARLDALKAASDDEFYRIAAFERTPADLPTKYCVRLGNRFYPHMKLVIERSPDAEHALFSADTHDRHILAKPDSSEAMAFAELVRNNQDLSKQIETKWDEAGIPTFKRFLRDDLAKRRTAAPGAE
jgi:hypothetical protein